MALTTDIKSLLPHREPFLFVDAIISADEKGCVCEHTFTENEFFFKGHLQSLSFGEFLPQTILVVHLGLRFLFVTTLLLTTW